MFCFHPIQYIKMSETYQKLAFTRPIVVLKSGLKNNWIKKLDRVNRPLQRWVSDRVPVSSIRPVEGDSETGMTRLTAAIWNPLIPWCPNVVTFSFLLWDMLLPNSSKIGQLGDCCCSFLIETSKKFWKWKSLSLLENCWIDMEGQFYVEKDNSGHENSFFQS